MTINTLVYNKNIPEQLNQTIAITERSNDQELLQQATFKAVISQLNEPRYDLANAHEGLGWVQMAIQDWDQVTTNFTRAEQITMAEYESYGITDLDQFTAPVDLDKWLVLYWMSGDQAAFSETHGQWLDQRKSHDGHTENMDPDYTVHHMAGPQQIFTHPFIIQALESVQ